MTSAPACLVLRLAGPIQSWGGPSRFNRRQTNPEPTKSGIVGLLAAAHGRRRADPIEDLTGLRLGVRTDQPGTLLRDYHTVSDYTGRPLRSTEVSAKGQQNPTKYHTKVTERFYLQDAAFVGVLSGNQDLLRDLADAVQAPSFPLALGRRSCVPTQPIVLVDENHGLWSGTVEEVLAHVPWQAGQQAREQLSRRPNRPSWLELPTTVDDPVGTDVAQDHPVTFAPTDRSFVSRSVTHGWVRIPPPYAVDPAAPDVHDPFALLGW